MNANEPAFPHLHNTSQQMNESELWPGLTKREEFVRSAMIGILSNPHVHWGDMNTSPKGIAGVAVDVADAVLAELEKSK